MDEEILDKLEVNHLKLASVAKRSYAFFIDDLIVSALVFAVYYESISGAKNIEEVIMIVNSAFWSIIAIKVIYHTFFVWKYGATMGKMLFNIRVVDEKSFLNLDFGKSLLRALGRILSESLFYLGFLWGMINPTKQTWHDKFAKSVVIDA